MKNNKSLIEENSTDKNSLECFPGRSYGYSRSPSVPTRKMPISISAPLNAIWVFSLPLAIEFAGQNIKASSHTKAAANLRSKWNANESTQIKAIEPQFSIKGFSIGWKINSKEYKKIPQPENVFLCNSPEVTAGVLAHIDSGLLLVNTSPLFSIDRFLEGPFAFTEPILKDESLFLQLNKNQIDNKLFA